MLMYATHRSPLLDDHNGLIARRYIRRPRITSANKAYWGLNSRDLFDSSSPSLKKNARAARSAELHILAVMALTIARTNLGHTHRFLHPDAFVNNKYISATLRARAAIREAPPLSHGPSVNRPVDGEIVRFARRAVYTKRCFAVVFVRTNRSDSIICS